MINICGFNFILPAPLLFLSGTLSSFLGTILTSAIVALAIYILILGLLKLVFRKSDTEVDNIILRLTRWPLIVSTILIGLERFMATSGKQALIVVTEKILWVLIAIIITFWASNLLKAVAIYQLQNDSLKSDEAWVAVLVPVFRWLLPLLIWVTGLLITIQSFGIDLTKLFVALGGVAFILTFALQDILSNLFSGLVLLFDTPFQFGDVIMLEDGTMAVVENIGFRMTHLYNTKNHSDIFVPNSLLGSKSIVNFTRPTPDLADSLSVSVSYTSDTKYNTTHDINKNVTNILLRVIYGHPDVFGPIDEKLTSLASFSQLMYGDKKKEAARKRLLLEQKLNEILRELEDQLHEFARIASQQEKGGLDYKEKILLERHCSEILETLGLKASPVHKKWFSRPEPEIVELRNGDHQLIPVVYEWLNAWSCDPDLVEGDNNALYYEWGKKIFLLKIQIERLYRKVIHPTGHERRLDYESRNIAYWIHSNFKESRVLWKDPDIRLVNFGASSLDFEVGFYVDNMKLEHYRRADRIKDELRREIKTRFDEAGIEIPFPQVDTWSRNT